MCYNKTEPAGNFILSTSAFKFWEKQEGLLVEPWGGPVQMYHFPSQAKAERY